MVRRRYKYHKQQEADLSVEINRLSHDGRGIAELDGKTTFLQGGLKGESVRFRYLQQRRRFDEGVVTEVLTESQQRVNPICPHFGVCGGCSLQHMGHIKQLMHKEETLLEQLQHFGGVRPQEILPPLAGSNWGYRRKARLGVRYVIKKGRLIVGFRERNGRYLAELTQCPVLHPDVGEKIQELAEMISTLSAYQQIPQIEVAVGENATALVIRHLLPMPDKDYQILEAFAKKYQFWIYLQPGAQDTIKRVFPLKADPLLYYDLPDHQLRMWFHPVDFTQINFELNQQMVNQALTLLDVQPNDSVLDLFCGLGNFTLPIAKKVKQVTGVEGADHMVQRARMNAEHNQINNVDFFRADLTQPGCDARLMNATFDKVLLDPPRTGAIELMPFVLNWQANKILYVSCNPATLARDAGELSRVGYQLKKVGIMDMFPHTSHVESIALFEKA